MSDVRTELRTEMSELGSELRNEMSELRTELRVEMSEVRSAVAANATAIDGLSTKVDAQRTELVGTMDTRFAALESNLALQFAQQTRQLTIGMVGFAVATWSALLGGAIFT